MAHITNQKLILNKDTIENFRNGKPTTKTIENDYKKSEKNERNKR